MPTFIVDHGSVSGVPMGGTIELTQEQADHINSSGKMLRLEGEEKEPRQRAKVGKRIGLDGKTKTVELDGKVIDSAVDGEPLNDVADEPEEVEVEEAPAEKPAPAKKAATRPSRKRGG